MMKRRPPKEGEDGGKPPAEKSEKKKRRATKVHFRSLQGEVMQVKKIKIGMRPTREAPQLDPIIKPIRIGPGRDAKIEARFSGPDPLVLRQLSEQAQAIMRADAEAVDVRNDWRSPVKVVTPVFNEQVGRQLGITREDLGGATRYAFDGIPAGSYRDGNRVLPLLMRASENERGDVDALRDVQIWSAVLGRTVPASAVIALIGAWWFVERVFL